MSGVFSKGPNIVPLTTLIQEGLKCPTVTTGNISVEVMHNFEKAAQDFSITRTLPMISKLPKSLTVLMIIELLTGLKLITIDLSQ